MGPADGYGVNESLLGPPEVTSLTSLSSSGVPSIGTKALTGKDSGCSGMLALCERHTAQRRRVVYSLRNLPNEANTILVGLAQAQDTTRADADPRVTNSGYCVQPVIV